MSQFEKALIRELQGIRKELHEMNRSKPEKGQVDGASTADMIANGIAKSLHGATLVNGERLSR